MITKKNRERLTEIAKSDIGRLTRQHNDASADFRMRMHRCQECETLYSHQCKGNHRYICDTCKVEHQEESQ